MLYFLKIAAFHNKHVRLFEKTCTCFRKKTYVFFEGHNVTVISRTLKESDVLKTVVDLTFCLI